MTTRKTKLSTSDKKATKSVAMWVKTSKESAARRMVSDPDLRLCAIEYHVPGMGTKVLTVRDGLTVAWFDHYTAALEAISSAMSEPR